MEVCASWYASTCPRRMISAVRDRKMIHANDLLTKTYFFPVCTESRCLFGLLFAVEREKNMSCFHQQESEQQKSFVFFLSISIMYSNLPKIVRKRSICQCRHLSEHWKKTMACSNSLLKTLETILMSPRPRPESWLWALCPVLAQLYCRNKMSKKGFHFLEVEKFNGSERAPMQEHIFQKVIEKATEPNCMRLKIMEQRR